MWEGGPQHVPHDEKYFRERQGHGLSPALRGHAGLIYKPHGLKKGFLWKIACESDVSRIDGGSNRRFYTLAHIGSAKWILGI